jgi:hydrogenase 3 maturation protease
MNSQADLPYLLAHRLRGRAVVMGIGNPLRGDDGIGCRVARLLQEAVETGDLAPPAGLTILDAEEIPESFLGPAVAARPETVLLVDAVEMGAGPGSAALLEVDDLRAGALFTHRTPLGPLTAYLRQQTRADIALLAIQPASIEWGAGLSPELARAAETMTLMIRHALQEAHPC